jgi:ketosteroid isomerase-like protein
MTTLLENPWPGLLAGIIVSMLLAIAYFAVPKRGILIAMGVAVAATLGMFLLERFVVTPAEEVEQTLYDLAATLQTNDVPAVLEFVSPDAAMVRGAAQRHMPRYQINEVHIASNLEVKVNEADPTKAVAKFNCRVNANDRRGELPYNNALLQFSINFEKVGDKWLIAEYDVNQPEIRMGK